MKLGWYINRLRNMEPAELLHRLAEKRRKLASRTRDEGWARYPATKLRAVFPGLRDAILAAGPAQRDAISHAAGETLAGRFSALGRSWPVRSPANLFPPEFWRLDPVSGTPWPGSETYAFDIDFRNGDSRGDIKYVWEANRLQVLPPLAAHALLTGSAPALATIEAAIASWHGANPPFRGVGWASGIEVALRAISVIVTLDLAGDRLSAETHQKAAEILTASAFWLPRFPSNFSSANNHLVAELTGQYLIGLALGTDPRAPRAALLREIGKQILPDGVGAEQTPTYAAFTAELALLSAFAAHAAGTPFPAAFDARLVAFADFIRWLGPETARLGDDDEGRVLTLGDEPDYPRSVAAAIAGFLRQPGLSPAPGDFRALVFGAPPPPAPAPRGLRTFAEGGLSVWHGDLLGRRVDLTFDHGPLGYLSIAAHGHADALALTLAIDGIPVLVDPGTYLYGSGSVWRDWFRSTPAHNTLNIDGESQSRMSGAFNWSHKATAQLAEGGLEPDWWLRANHDGYRRRFGVTHQRTLEIDPEGLAVTDQLLGGSKLAAEIVFQLAPGLDTRLDGKTVTVLRGTQPLLAIHFPDAAIRIASGGGAPGAGGWVSPRFGTKLAAPRLAWRGEVGDGAVTTWLVPLARPTA